MASVGMIGLGNMGAPMAANLVKAGHQVVGFDLSKPAMQALAEAGGQVAGSAAEATHGAEFVITMLPAGRHVREVWLHQGGLIEALKARGARPLLIDCSTIDVESARAVEQAARARRVRDAGRAGFGRNHRRGGGDLDLHGRRLGARLRPWRADPEGDGPNHRPCRRAGCGSGGEDLQQHDAGDQHDRRLRGVPAGAQARARLGQAVRHHRTSSGQSWALTNYCPAPGQVAAAPSNRDYAPGFAAELMVKDVGLAQEAAEATGSPTPLGAHALALYRAAVAAGEGGRDFSAVFRWLAGQDRDKLE